MIKLKWFSVVIAQGYHSTCVHCEGSNSSVPWNCSNCQCITLISHAAFMYHVYNSLVQDSACVVLNAYVRVHVYSIHPISDQVGNADHF